MIHEAFAGIGLGFIILSGIAISARLGRGAAAVIDAAGSAALVLWVLIGFGLTSWLISLAAVWVLRLG